MNLIPLSHFVLCFILSIFSPWPPSSPPSLMPPWSPHMHRATGFRLRHTECLLAQEGHKSALKNRPSFQKWAKPYSGCKRRTDFLITYWPTILPPFLRPLSLSLSPPVTPASSRLSYSGCRGLCLSLVSSSLWSHP